VGPGPGGGLRWRDQAARWDADDEAPYHDVVTSTAEYGLLGLTMPARYGGRELTALDYVIVVEELFHQSQHWITGEPTFCSTGPVHHLAGRRQGHMGEVPS